MIQSLLKRQKFDSFMLRVCSSSVFDITEYRTELERQTHWRVTTPWHPVSSFRALRDVRLEIKLQSNW